MDSPPPPEITPAAEHLLSQVAVELKAPDIRGYRKLHPFWPGIDYVIRMQSSRPGPHVLIQALTHGNELCGAIAIDYLMRETIRPERGVLSLVFANVEAYRRWNPEHPHSNRYCDEDYNRVWSDEVLNSTRDSIELRRARALCAYVDSADFLLDLHSMSAPCEPLMVCGVREGGGLKAVELSRALGLPRWLMMDTGHSAGLRMIERRAFADPHARAVAVLLEAGQHWENSTAQVAIDLSLRFLAHTGTVNPSWAQSRCGLPTTPQQVIQVTEAVIAQSLDFVWLGDYQGLEIVPDQGTPVARDGDLSICTPYPDCVLVMPTRARFAPGQTMLRFGRML
jgi:predicted deacylase